MIKRNFFLIFFLLLGICILYFNQSIVDMIDSILSERDNRPTVATIQFIDGNVRIKKAKTLKFKNGYLNQELKDQDTLTTDESSRAKIAFNSGDFEIQVEPNSLIVIEKPQKDSQGRIQITFLKGEFKVLKTGEAGQIIISKDKKFQDLAGRTPQDPLKIALKDPSIELPPPPPPTETILAPAIQQEKLEEKKKVIVEKEPEVERPKKPKETLSDDYISQIIASQKPFFERCYTQHLRLNPDSRGIIHLSFTVSPKGKVASVSLVQSTISDPQLERCTMSVIERCRFKNFDGDPIVVNYPINFE